MKKKLLGVFLSFCIVFTLLPVSVAADTAGRFVDEDGVIYFYQDVSSCLVAGGSCEFKYQLDSQTDTAKLVDDGKLTNKSLYEGASFEILEKIT